MKYKKNSLLLLSFLLCLPSQNPAMTLEQAKNKLSETNTYHIFDVLSSEEKNSLKGMNIKAGAYLFNENCNPKDFEDCLTHMDNNAATTKLLVPILTKLCTKLSKIPNFTTEIFPAGIVAETESNNFNNKVNWHIDISGQACNEPGADIIKDAEIYRVLVNLQGKGTIFVQPNSQEKNKFFNCFCKDPNGHNSDTVKLAQTILLNSRQEQLQPGQAVIFSQKESIHTRPDTTEPRAIMTFSFHNMFINAQQTK